jgi:hypothetical protein
LNVEVNENEDGRWIELHLNETMEDKEDLSESDVDVDEQNQE